MLFRLPRLMREAKASRVKGAGILPAPLHGGNEMHNFDPRRHYWPVVRAHNLLGQALKAAVDALHPGDATPATPPPQVIVVPMAQVQTAAGTPATPAPAGSVIVVQQPAAVDTPSSAK
jgi:hypothetical protein